MDQIKIDQGGAEQKGEKLDTKSISNGKGSCGNTKLLVKKQKKERVE